MAECLRSDESHDDIFADYDVSEPTPFKQVKTPARKRPRFSSQDMFLSSSPESTSGIDLTPFFGKPPQEKSVLQILDINRALDGNIGKLKSLFSYFIKYSFIPENKFTWTLLLHLLHDIW